MPKLGYMLTLLRAALYFFYRHPFSVITVVTPGRCYILYLSIYKWHFYIFSYPFTHIKLELAKCIVKTFPAVKGPSQYGEGHVSRLFIYDLDIVTVLRVGHLYCFFWVFCICTAVMMDNIHLCNPESVE